MMKLAARSSDGGRRIESRGGCFSVTGKRFFTFALVSLLVLVINRPVSLFALGQYDGFWLGPETITVPGYGSETLTIGVPIYQEDANTLYFYDVAFGAVPLIRSGGQWVLASPIWTTFLGYQAQVTAVSITFHSFSYMTGSITVQVLGVTATGTLSHTRQSCQNLTNGSTVSGLSGAMDSIRCYEVVLPSGATDLDVQTWGGSGDCDLGLIYHRPDFDFYTSEDDFNQEQITVFSPASGKWYIFLVGFETYSGLNLRVSFSEIPAPPGDEAIIDFGASGLWGWYNNTSWSKLHPGSPDLVTTGDMDGNGQDDGIIDFGASGVWVWMNDSTWTNLHSSNPDSLATGDMDNNGKDEVIIDFGTSGTWVRMNNASWTKLHSSNPDSITTGDMDGNGQDDVIIDFGSSGIWVRLNNASWTKLHPSNPDTIATGDMDNNGEDEVIIDFGSSGIWVWMNNTSWTKLHPSNPDGIYTGDMDGNGQGDVIIDFGNSGIWVRMNGSSWVKLHSSNPDSITTGDLDGSGQAEVIIDFGSSGLWARYNNASWTKLHSADCEVMATGNIDGN